jgi:hypothetical protein
MIVPGRGEPLDTIRIALSFNRLRTNVAQSSAAERNCLPNSGEPASVHLCLSLSNVSSHDFYPLELSCTRAITDCAVFPTFENNGPPTWAESSLGFWSGGELAQELLTLLE